MDTPSRQIDPNAPSPVDVYIEALGKGSQRTMLQSLQVAAARIAGKSPEATDPHAFDWPKVNGAAVARLKRGLAEDYAPSTANKILAALRGVLRVHRDMGYITEARFQAATRFDPVKDFRSKESRVLTEPELKELFQGCVEDGTAAGRRDAALLVVFLMSGLRREEVTELDVDDFDPKSGSLHIRSPLAERDRAIELGESGVAALNHWLEARGLDPGPLLMPVDKGGTIRFRRLTAQAVYGIVGRISERVGLPPVSTRDLRRTCIVRLIRSGRDLQQVRHQVGHLSWLTTAAYQALAEEAGQLKTIQLPYEPPPPPPPPPGPPAPPVPAP